MKTECLRVASSVKGGWNVSKNGGKRALKWFPGKRDAIAHARKLGEAQGLPVYIHNPDGSVNRVLPQKPTDKEVRALKARIEFLEECLACFGACTKCGQHEDGGCECDRCEECGELEEDCECKE